MAEKLSFILEMPHVAMLPYPAQGHTPSMIHLARKLAAEGFIVTLITIDSIHQKLSEQWKCLPGEEIHLEGVHCDYNALSGILSEGLEPEVGIMLDAIERIADPVEKILHRLKPAPCCLIADYFFTWAPNLAKALRISSATFWPANAAYSSLHHHLELLVAKGDAFEEEEADPDKLISYVPGVETLRSQDLPDYMRKRGPDQLTYAFFSREVDRMKHSEWILTNSMAELEPQTFRAMQESLKNFVSVGPLFPLTDPGRSPGVRLRDEDEGCIKWLDTQENKSVLYISFGSGSTMSEIVFQELAAGLEASKRPFLWVIRSGLVKGTTEETFEKFRERTKKQGLIVSWAPQLQVLDHSSVGGFLSHCGWNSTFESISYGVPLLCWPFHSDQNLNCKLVVEDWKLGKKFADAGAVVDHPQNLDYFEAGTVVDRAEAEQRINEFMNGSSEMNEMRSRVSGFKELAHETIREGGQSHTNLKKFVQAMQKKQEVCKAVSPDLS